MKASVLLGSLNIASRRRHEPFSRCSNATCPLKSVTFEMQGGTCGFFFLGESRCNKKSWKTNKCLWFEAGSWKYTDWLTDYTKNFGFLSGRFSCRGKKDHIWLVSILFPLPELCGFLGSSFHFTNVAPSPPPVHNMLCRPSAVSTPTEKE